MLERRSIEVKGLGHGGAPFPLASRKGPFVASSAVSGHDALTGELPASVEAQARQAFANVTRVLEAAGAGPADVIKVVVFARDRAVVRAALDVPWDRLFPDPASRPVRHTIEAVLPAGLHLQVEVLAVVDQGTP